MAAETTNERKRFIVGHGIEKITQDKDPELLTRGSLNFNKIPELTGDMIDMIPTIPTEDKGHEYFYRSKGNKILAGRVF